MTVTCPYCGESYTPAACARHSPRCTHNPTVYAATRALLADPDHPGCARTRDEYAVIARTHAHAMSSRILYERFGSWAAACAEFGLEQPPPPVRGPRKRNTTPRTREEVQEMKLAAAQAEAIARTRAEEQERGLPVCDKPRLIDGGRRVAWMVR